MSDAHGRNPDEVERQGQPPRLPPRVRRSHRTPRAARRVRSARLRRADCVISQMWCLHARVKLCTFASTVSNSARARSRPEARRRLPVRRRPLTHRRRGRHSRRRQRQRRSRSFAPQVQSRAEVGLQLLDRALPHKRGVMVERRVQVDHAPCCGGRGSGRKRAAARSSARDGGRAVAPAAMPGGSSASGSRTTSSDSVEHTAVSPSTSPTVSRARCIAQESST